MLQSNSFFRKLCRSVFILFLWPAVLFAQEEKKLAPVTRTYAITNVNIIQGPGRKIDMGTIVVKDGLIVAVGKGIAVPPEATVIKADSMYVYAGFIDGLSNTGVKKPKEEREERVKDPGNPPPDRAGINPQVDVRQFLDPAERSVEEMRNLGFTVAQVVPYGNFLPGKAAVILLNGKSADDMVLVNQTALYSELTGARGMYPSTTMAVMAKWRELYRQSSYSKSYDQLYASNRNGLPRSGNDHILEAFYPVIDQRIPVLFKSEKILEAQRIMTLKSDLGFPLVLADVKEGWPIINKLKASGAKIFLSLDLPEEIKKEEKKDGKKEEKPKGAAGVEKEALDKRKADAIASYTAQAAEFQKAGIPFGFSASTAKSKDIPANLRRMIAAGLSEDAALAALTTTPAQLLGLSDRIGSIDAGKMANLVISDKSYFNEKAKVRYVFVDGDMFKLEVKETKKGDANAKVELEGSWSTAVESPQGKMENKLTFTKDGSGFKGNITGGMLPSAIELQAVSLDGKTLSFKYTFSAGGQSIDVTVDATIEGDTMKGTASVPGYGSMPLEGTKDPKK